MSSQTQRRQRCHSAAFLSSSASPFLVPATTAPTRFPVDRSSRSSTVRPLLISAHVAEKPKIKRGTTTTKRSTQSSGSSVASPLPRESRPPSLSRFSQPVPDAQPHEVMPTRRGRDSRRRVREAEHFRRYIYLRRQLKPWSDDFRAQHGRTPSLIDVHASDIPGLLDRFVEYLEALEGIRFDVRKAEI